MMFIFVEVDDRLWIRVDRIQAVRINKDKLVDGDDASYIFTLDGRHPFESDWSVHKVMAAIAETGLVMDPEAPDA